MDFVSVRFFYDIDSDILQHWNHLLPDKRSNVHCYQLVHMHVSLSLYFVGASQRHPKEVKNRERGRRPGRVLIVEHMLNR